MTYCPWQFLVSLANVWGRRLCIELPTTWSLSFDLGPLYWSCNWRWQPGGKTKRQQKSPDKMPTDLLEFCLDFFCCHLPFFASQFFGHFVRTWLGILFEAYHLIEIHFYYHHLPSPKRPNLAFLVIFGQALPTHLVPCWWVGWWLWRAGCISQDTYLLYALTLRQNWSF